MKRKFFVMAVAMCTATSVVADEGGNEASGSSELEAVEPVEEVSAPGGPESRGNVFPIVKYRKSDDHSRVKVLNALSAEGYEYERHGDRTETEVLDVPFASLLETEREGDDHSSVKFLNAPFTTVVSAEKSGESKETKRLDIPFFTLAESEREEDGDFDRKAIKLPILGSLFRHKREGDTEKVRFLFFKHTRKVDAEDEDEEKEERRRPRRYHGH